MEGAGVADACLCHGAAGLGHIFHRIFLWTGDPALEDAARRWLGHALEMRVRGAGIAGYKFVRPDREGIMSL